MLRRPFGIWLEPRPDHFYQLGKKGSRARNCCFCWCAPFRVKTYTNINDLVIHTTPIFCLIEDPFNRWYFFLPDECFLRSFVLSFLLRSYMGSREVICVPNPAQPFFHFFPGPGWSCRFQASSLFFHFFFVSTQRIHLQRKKAFSFLFSSTFFYMRDRKPVPMWYATFVSSSLVTLRLSWTVHCCALVTYLFISAQNLKSADARVSTLLPVQNRLSISENIFDGCSRTPDGSTSTFFWWKRKATLKVSSTKK